MILDENQCEKSAMALCSYLLETLTTVEQKMLAIAN